MSSMAGRTVMQLTRSWAATAIVLTEVCSSPPSRCLRLGYRSNCTPFTPGVPGSKLLHREVTITHPPPQSSVPSTELLSPPSLLPCFPPPPPYPLQALAAGALVRIAQRVPQSAYPSH
jgi:hypothetical protein